MSPKLSVEEVLAQLEQHAVFHREREAFHSREERALHAAELEKILENLEAFRTVAATAVDLAGRSRRSPFRTRRSCRRRAGCRSAVCCGASS